MRDRQKTEDDSPWTYQPDAATAVADEPAVPAPDEQAPAEAKTPSPAGEEDSISWTASEYLQHDKGFMWYLILAGGTFVAAIIVFIITRDMLSTSVVFLAALMLGIFAFRKPRVLTYKLSVQGITVGAKFYPYTLFKSFTLVEENGMPSIEFLPLKRFMTPLSIYFDPKDAEDIVTVISNFLPHDQREVAMVDRMMHRIRF